jgi:hypothetical protein
MATKLEGQRIGLSFGNIFIIEKPFLLSVNILF